MKAPTGATTGGHSSGQAVEHSVAPDPFAHAAAGWPVHRLELGGKRAVTPHGLLDATTDPTEIRTMFAEPGNIGTPGTERDLFLDIDVPKASAMPDASDEERRQVAVRRLEELHERFPETRAAPIQQTPSGGFHVQLTLPDEYVGAAKDDPRHIPTGYFPGTATPAERWGEIRGMGRAYVVMPGCSTPDGTYRPVTASRGPGTGPVASEALLRWLRPSRAARAPQRRQDPVRVGDSTSAYGRRALEAEADAVATTREGGRNERLNAAAFSLGQLVAGGEIATEAEVVDALTSAAEACQLDTDPGCGPEGVRKTIRSGLEAGKAQPRTAPERPQRSPVQRFTEAPQRASGRRAAWPAPPDLALLDFEEDDGGNAERLAHMHFPHIRYHVGRGWLVYVEEEHRHVSGEAAEAEADRRMLLTMRSITATAQQLGNDKEREKWEAYARRNASRAKREAALALARVTRIRAYDHEIDPDPLAINTPDGLLDLRTLELKPHDPDDPRPISTAVTQGRYRPDAQHPAWDAMLDLLRQDGRAEYLQRALGQAITGRTNREMFVLHGPKATGKTTLAEGLMRALGQDYAATVDPGTLLEARRSSAGAARSDLVALASARFALSSEPNSRAKLDGALVKRMTGSDSITARATYARTPITFRPAFTIVMLANEVPAADWTDDALLSRLKLIPFRAKPPRIDPAVRAALVDDPDQTALDAIFTWAAQGAYGWIRDGMSMGDEPEVVAKATDAYRLENDPFALWAEERLRFDQADAVTTVSDLHDDYKQWTERNGVTEPLRVEALGKWLKGQAEAGADIERKRTKAGSSWQGVRIVGPTG